MKADYGEEAKRKNADKDKKVQAAIDSLKITQCYRQRCITESRPRYPSNNNFLCSSLRGTTKRLFTLLILVKLCLKLSLSLDLLFHLKPLCLVQEALLDV